MDTHRSPPTTTWITSQSEFHILLRSTLNPQWQKKHKIKGIWRVSGIVAGFLGSDLSFKWPIFNVNLLAQSQKRRIELKNLSMVFISLSANIFSYNIKYTSPVSLELPYKWPFISRCEAFLSEGAPFWYWFHFINKCAEVARFVD